MPTEGASRNASRPEDVADAQDKRPVDHILLEQLVALKAEVRSLREQLQTHLSPDPHQKSREFLLAEFEGLVEFWRQTDTRVEGTLNLYLTASALTASALVFLFQQNKDIRLYIGFVTVVAAALLAAGFLLSVRIQGTVLLKAGYIRGLNLIRRYFVDHRTIAEYLSLPFAEKGADVGTLGDLPSPGLLLKGILAWDSLLVGFICAALAWLVQPRLLLEFLLGGALVIAVACYSLLSQSKGR